MKSILISIRPKWVEKILNGKKTLEIRKTAPKCDLPIDVYIYCTKEETYWKYPYVNELRIRKENNRICDWWGEYGKDVIKINEGDYNEYKAYKCRGKVVAKFTLKKIERIYITDKLHCRCKEREWQTETPSLSPEELCESSCLTQEGIYDCLTNGNGYAWHISDLVIFNEPRELDEFEYLNPSGIRNIGQRELNGKKSKKHPPQSWCYVEVKE